MTAESILRLPNMFLIVEDNIRKCNHKQICNALCGSMCQLFQLHTTLLKFFFSSTCVSHFQSYTISKNEFDYECCTFQQITNAESVWQRMKSLLSLSPFFQTRNFPRHQQDMLQLPLLFLYGLIAWHLALDSIEVTHTNQELTSFLVPLLLANNLNNLNCFFFFFINVDTQIRITNSESRDPSPCPLFRKVGEGITECFC